MNSQPSTFKINDVKQSQFHSSDAWLLASIFLGDKGSGASYIEVIEAADLVNHARLTSLEFQSGLARLLETNWVQISDNKFSISTEKSPKLEKLKILGVAKIRDQIEKMLGLSPGYVPFNTKDPLLNVQCKDFSEKLFSEADLAYNKKSKKGPSK